MDPFSVHHLSTPPRPSQQTVSINAIHFLTTILAGLAQPTVFHSRHEESGSRRNSPFTKPTATSRPCVHASSQILANEEAESEFSSHPRTPVSTRDPSSQRQPQTSSAYPIISLEWEEDEEDEFSSPHLTFLTQVSSGSLLLSPHTYLLRISAITAESDIKSEEAESDFAPSYAGLQSLYPLRDPSSTTTCSGPSFSLSLSLSLLTHIGDGERGGSSMVFLGGA